MLRYLLTLLFTFWTLTAVAAAYLPDGSHSHSGITAEIEALKTALEDLKSLPPVVVTPPTDNPDIPPPDTLPEPTPGPEGGPGKEFRAEWSLSTAESLAKGRTKWFNKAKGLVTLDTAEEAARIRLGQYLSIGSADQLWMIPPRRFGPMEGDSLITWGWSVKYDKAWGETQLSGLKNHKLVRLDNDKTHAGLETRPYNDRMIEFNSRYSHVDLPAVASVGTRFYTNDGIHPTGFTEFQEFHPLYKDDGVTRIGKWWDYQPGGDTVASNMDTPYSLEDGAADRGPFLIKSDVWYDFRYVWTLNPVADKWWIHLYGKEAGKSELLIISREYDLEKMTAAFLRIEMDTSQNRVEAWTPEQGHHDIWVKDVFIEAR